MEKRIDEIVNVLGSNHPARPYLLMGGVVMGIGLIRNSLSSLVLLGLGGALVSRGLREMDEINSLHGGNHHGVNAPPLNV